MSEPKKVDRRKFIYAGLGAVALIAIGAAAYVAMNPPVVTKTVTTSTTVPTTSVVTTTSVATTTVPTTSVVTSTITTPKSEMEKMMENIEKYCQGAKINWRQKEGTSIYVLFLSNPYSETLRAFLPLFEKMTGIHVAYDVLPATEYWTKTDILLGTGKGVVDAVMNHPLINPEWAGANWVMPLNEFLFNEKLFDPNWFDVDDVIPTSWYACSGHFTKLETGKQVWVQAPKFKNFNEASMAWDKKEEFLWLLQAHFEGQTFYYRKDLFSKYNVDVKTWEDCLTAAPKLTLDLDKDGKIDVYAWVARNKKGWNNAPISYAPMYSSYCDKGWLGEGWRPIFQNIVKPFEIFVELSKPGRWAPPEILNYDWYFCSQDFAAGKIAMYCPDAHSIGSTFLNPQKSKVVETTGFAHPPKGPLGIGGNMIGWGISVCSQSTKKEAAFLFALWAANKEYLKYTAPYGNLAPIRHSAYEWLRQTKPQGFPMEWVDQMEEFNEKYNKISLAGPPGQFGVLPEMKVLYDALSTAFQNAISGKMTCQDALNWCADEWVRILKQAGYPVS